MELTDLITALGGSAGVIAIVKALFTDKATRAITDDRKLSKENYDSRFVKLEIRMDNVEKRLEDGNAEFKSLAEELKVNNGLLREILGMLREHGFNVGKMNVGIK